MWILLKFMRSLWERPEQGGWESKGRARRRGRGGARGGEWGNAKGNRKLKQNRVEDVPANVWNIMRELWEDYESIMRRGREREAEEEAEVRKQGGIGGGRSWRKAKGRGIKFWGEEGSKGRGNHERIMRRLWENHENIDGSESQKKMAANMIPIDLYESKHYLLGKH